MKVSIIIPVYNVAPYIEDCLHSVIHQTYKGGMECLIVDDCGIDDSMAIVERMIAEYDGPIQFKILRHEHNRGLSAARNTGTMQATGDYLYYLDSDDEITNDCIEKLLGVVQEYPEVEMVQGNNVFYGIHVTESSNNVFRSIAETNEDVRTCSYSNEQLRIYVWNKLLLRSFVIKNNLLCKENIIHEDVLWNFYLLKYLRKAFWISDITYSYRYRPNSITTGIGNKTNALNLCIITQEIVSNLTPGYERQEFDYFSTLIFDFDIKYTYEIPIFNEVLKLCYDKGKLYGGNVPRIKCALRYYLGRNKNGWIIWEILKRVKHPFRISRDVKRIKSKLFPPSSYPALN